MISQSKSSERNTVSLPRPIAQPPLPRRLVPFPPSSHSFILILCDLLARLGELFGGHGSRVDDDGEFKVKEEEVEEDEDDGSDEEGVNPKERMTPKEEAKLLKGDLDIDIDELKRQRALMIAKEKAENKVASSFPRSRLCPSLTFLRVWSSLPRQSAVPSPSSKRTKRSTKPSLTKRTKSS